MIKEAEELTARMNMGAAANTLEHQWFDSPDQGEVFSEALLQRVAAAFKAGQKDYLQRLFDDGNGHLKYVLVNFSIDKQQLFNDNMEQLRTLYLNDTVERLKWEQDDIKRSVLRRIMNYVNGKTDTLELKDLTDLAYTRGDNLARLFARDQMARFNKAVTLSTFVQAGVTKLQWVTSHDVRVRDSHKALDGKIFDIKNLPKEIDDYNCRCGLVPVEWADD